MTPIFNKAPAPYDALLRELREILGAELMEPLRDAARRVVKEREALRAERDASKKQLDDKIEAGMWAEQTIRQQRERIAEQADRITQLEARLAPYQE